LRRLTTLFSSSNSNRCVTITRKTPTAPSVFKRSYRYAAHMAQSGISSLINARWVIPVVPENKILEHHTIAIDNAGDIVDVLPIEEAKKKYLNVPNVVDRPHHIVLPGLINMHSHSPMVLLRGFADDMPLMDWLNNKIMPAEQKWVTPEFTKDGTTLAAAEMIRSGTTCFNDMYFFPEASAEAIERIGMRAAFSSIILKFPSMYSDTLDGYFTKAQQLIKQYKNHPRIQITLGPHAPYTVNDAQFERVVKMAHENNVKIHLHLHETAAEVEGGLKENNQRPFARMEKLGVINPSLIAVHCTQLTDEEIASLAKHGCSVAHCPESNAKLASGYCPVPKLNQQGANVCLGTDGAASNNDLDMFVEMRTSALFAKYFTMDAKAADAFSVLKMATINGAKALGLEKRIGSLEIGKEADMIAINLNSIETVPMYNPLSHLVYCSGRESVTDMWVAGKQLMNNRKLLTMDEEQVMANARAWAEKIAKDH
jgi:5-methylthioadenosine/S-adenosylhomocysteine deaminase